MALYGIENWIDEIAKAWEEIVVDHKQILSYKINNIPEAINQTPCVVNFVKDVSETYALNGSALAVYRGESHFHLSSDLNRKKISSVMGCIAKIVEAAAGHITLSGKVTAFYLVKNQSIEVVELKWGGENEHLGLVASWIVEESHAGKYLIKA